MFAVEPYRIEFEDVKAGKWKPGRVIGVAMNDEREPSYIVETAGNTACLLVVDYIRHPDPYPRRPSA